MRGELESSCDDTCTSYETVFECGKPVSGRGDSLLYFSKYNSFQATGIVGEAGQIKENMSNWGGLVTKITPDKT